MRFGILGPLAVWTHDGREVTIPELKVRLLVADLLVHDGGPVRPERLVEDLWGGRPPRNPGAVLRSKVSQLRRVFEDAEPGGRDLVVHDRAGYRLRLPPGGVDADRFSELVEAARSLPDPARRARLLSEALELWRGRPLADLADHELAWPTTARLEEERLAAVEDHLAARLALGEHEAVAAAAAGLLAEHPWRERLRALHMRSLYRGGRQSEALDSYEALRTALREARGLSPGRELAALQLAILDQDPDLDGEHGGASEVSEGLGAERPVAGVRPRRLTNLPAPTTPLVGRDAALGELRAALGSTRLLTLIGPGGVGKTRLALAAAAEALDRTPDGVWLVELAGIDDTRAAVGDVATEVARAVGLHEVRALPLAGDRLADQPDPDRPHGDASTVDRVADALAHALADRQALLVLDNCEHVVDAAAPLATRLLGAAPALRILATSREPLRVPGEVVWPVPPLDPDTDAVELFAARARAAAPAFTLDAGTAPVVATVCRRLDGIPLALELAATKVRTIGVRELARRLDDRFRLLGDGDRTAPPRHRTLRTMIDWSWDRLTAAERAVLRRLALGADGYDVEAAEHVCAGDGVDPGDVLTVLARLVDRSLVTLVESADSPDGADRPRYRLLETVAVYASERLDEAGDRDQAAARHDAYFVRLAETAAAGLRGPEQRRWLARLDAEASNLRRALAGTHRRRAADQALRLANALTWYWYLRGRFSEALLDLARALTSPGAAPAAARAEAAAAAAGFAWLAPDVAPPGVGAAGHALAALDACDDDPSDPDVATCRARAALFLALAHSAAGDPGTVLDLTETALAHCTALNDDWGVAACLAIRSAEAVTATGDLAGARRDAEASLAAFRRLGDEWGQLTGLQVLDALAEIAGDYAGARALAEQQRRIAERLGLPTELSYALSRLGRNALLTGDLAAAEDLHRRARQVATDQGNRLTEEVAELGLALGARRAGDLDRAETYLNGWTARHRDRQHHPGLALYLTELGFVAELRGDAPAALERHLEAHASAEIAGDPRAVARTLEGLAGAASLTGHARDAARLLGAAAALRRSAGAPLPAAERGDVDRITARLHAALGDPALEAGLRDGEPLAAPGSPAVAHLLTTLTSGTAATRPTRGRGV